MTKAALHILVDSRESSVSLARNIYIHKNRPRLGIVEHFRPVEFAARFKSLCERVDPHDEILVSARSIPAAQLPVGGALDRTRPSGTNRLTLAAYPCFTYLKEWCRQHGVCFVDNTYKRRTLSTESERTIHNYLEGRTRTLSGTDRLGLERIWIQYRLILAIISRIENLGEVVRQLFESRACDKDYLREECLRALRYHTLGEPDMAGGSYACERGSPNTIDRLRERINLIAATDYNVLIQGESGCGKETAAWAIHELSSRKDKPFMAVNCAGFSDELLESEMFGYVRGSHNQAESDARGLLETVDGGTLFLDELPDMGVRIQAKLLRCLETGEYRPIGGNENKYTNVRIIAAGQTSLFQQAGRVRPDLRSRIDQLNMELLPLRELEQRDPGTLHKIAYVLLERYVWTTVFRDGRRYELTPLDIRNCQEQLEQPELQARLTRARWQDSNIRELNNFLRQWLVFGDAEFNNLDSSGRQSGAGAEPSDQLTPWGELEPELADYLNIPETRKEFSRFFVAHPFKDVRKAYMKQVYRVYCRMVEQENDRHGLARKPTQKDLAGLLGITENTLSRYKN